MMEVEQGFTISSKDLICPSAHKAKLVCISSKCKQNGLMCAKEGCKCERDHENCEYFRIQSILKKLQTKKKNMSPAVQATMNSMQKIYDDAIERLSRDKEWIQDQVEYFGLSEDEAFFVRLVNDNCLAEITGAIVSKLMPTLDVQSEFTVNVGDMASYWKIYQVKFDAIFDNLKRLTTRTRHRFESKITEDIELISSFFDTPLVGFKLLYRASENNFSAGKFRQICDGKKNTIVIAQTEFDRIIGGFTQLQWSTYTTAYVQDHDRKNFLFSLTLKEKYPIISTQHGIYNNPNYGPTFGGGHDFYIADNANVADNTSYCKIGHSFNLNGKFKNNQVTSYTEFSGATVNQYVKFKEWEVFQVEFL